MSVTRMRFFRIVKIFGIVVGAIVLFAAILVVMAIVSRHGRVMLPVKHKDQFEHPAMGGFPAELHVEGNQLVTGAGATVRLRGLMPADPAKLDADSRFKQSFYSDVRTTGANVVRISVHPEKWVRDRDYLWRHLDPIVGWAGELGMYVIVDWHYIGNMETGAGDEMPDIPNPPRELTLQFWQLVAGYFRDAPHVVFEIWNEPAGGISGQAWERNASEVVQAIRREGAQQLIIVGGVEYARDLSWVAKNPIEDSNVAYASHIYPAHSSSNWDYWFGTVSATYPVLITEWGFMDENRTAERPYLSGTAAGYAEPFLNYLDSRGIGWVACWYDDEWDPPMFTPGWKAPTRYGAFVLEALRTGQ